MAHLQVLPETTLRCGSLRAVLAPSAGGRISGLFSEAPSRRVNWLQAMDDATRASGFDSTSWPKAGLYPLVPYSNRIREGRFEFEGRTVQLPLHPGDVHSLHGVSQQQPWTLVQHSDTSATMLHEHQQGDKGWPWPYRAEHTITVDDEGISLRLRVSNTGIEPAPCGAGFHPYFPIRFSEHVSFKATTVWTPDRTLLGTAPQGVQDQHDYSAARAVGPGELTQYYGGWSGHAALSADDGACIQMDANTALRHLVLYRPAGRDFFCVEPVSHVSNAANLAGQGHSHTGWQTLMPMQTLECQLRMTLSMN